MLHVQVCIDVPCVPTASETPGAWIPFFDGYAPDEAEVGHRTTETLVARFAAAPDQGDDRRELLVTPAYPIAWLLRDALGAAPVRWLRHSSANAALTVSACGADSPAGIVRFNDMTHLPPTLRCTGFPEALRPGRVAPRYAAQAFVRAEIWWD